MNIRSEIELQNESIVANDKIDKNPAYVKKSMTVEPSEYQNVRNNCYFVAKNETSTSEAIRKVGLLKEIWSNLMTKKVRKKCQEAPKMP